MENMFGFRQVKLRSFFFLLLLSFAGVAVAPPKTSGFWREHFEKTQQAVESLKQLRNSTQEAFYPLRGDRLVGHQGFINQFRSLTPDGMDQRDYVVKLGHIVRDLSLCNHTVANDAEFGKKIVAAFESLAGLFVSLNPKDSNTFRELSANLLVSENLFRGLQPIGGSLAGFFAAIVTAINLSKVAVNLRHDGQNQDGVGTTLKEASDAWGDAMRFFAGAHLIDKANDLQSHDFFMRVGSNACSNLRDLFLVEDALLNSQIIFVQHLVAARAARERNNLAELEALPAYIAAD